ncbi:unnamed protein product [Penicillium salamii]|uniref:Uncharacterized protein n=1 Tax=Penicillium salamii TaxID=1612424 RepID=A0A9W4IU21_9EURO|nr:unnamed protein product [Penicillium salamii]CAG8118447.1 unnamed protein product [Penicillium salamii]CAG8294120.1 unnamed protein product [Penicillium salamii]CAG8345475.1 unnamed protein product [Penicillium salamii]CAG8347469.1 unnamed protein product [Penicillium salamii]
MDNIAVDPDFYSLTKDWEPEDFESETTSIASTIARGRLENGRRQDSGVVENVRPR